MKHIYCGSVLLIILIWSFKDENLVKMERTHSYISMDGWVGG